jgi:hypothetical protein
LNIGVGKSELRRFTSWLGKPSYKARVKRLGLELILKARIFAFERNLVFWARPEGF